MKSTSANNNNKKSSTFSPFQIIVFVSLCIFIPWLLYVFYHPKFSSASENSVNSISLPQLLGLVHSPINENAIVYKKPVQGDIPYNGAKPVYGKHTGKDAVFALACNYHLELYKFFVGTLRKYGFEDDIVLAVSPPGKMKLGVEEYIQKTNVVAYGFNVTCEGKDNCKLQDDFLGYPDPRPTRPFANIRYALYEYWLNFYGPKSYIIILDFRDVFFQSNPFKAFGQYELRVPKYVLYVYAENQKMKTIGGCKFNSLWVGRCFGKEALEQVRNNSVICSGSTIGSYEAISYYVKTMLETMDTVQCWRKGIESDQGYQNYLFYNGKFNSPNGDGNATKFDQGNGIVNTIGAMNGRRIQQEHKGSLTAFWKIRDSQGRIINNDGTVSPIVHQWDRWFQELKQYVFFDLAKDV